MRSKYVCPMCNAEIAEPVVFKDFMSGKRVLCSKGHVLYRSENLMANVIGALAIGAVLGALTPLVRGGANTPQPAQVPFFAYLIYPICVLIMVTITVAKFWKFRGLPEPAGGLLRRGVINILVVLAGLPAGYALGMVIRGALL